MKQIKSTWQFTSLPVQFARACPAWSLLFFSGNPRDQWLVCYVLLPFVRHRYRNSCAFSSSVQSAVFTVSPTSFYGISTILAEWPEKHDKIQYKSCKSSGVSNFTKTVWLYRDQNKCRKWGISPEKIRTKNQTDCPLKESAFHTFVVPMGGGGPKISLQDFNISSSFVPSLHFRLLLVTIAFPPVILEEPPAMSSISRLPLRVGPNKSSELSWKVVF